MLGSHLGSQEQTCEGLCSDFYGAIFARDYKKIPRTMLFPIISCRYLSGSETGIKGSG